MKGMIVSIDSAFAILIAFFFLIFILNSLTFDYFSPIKIQRVGADVLTTLEATNSLFNPEQVFNQTGAQLCMQLDIYDGTYTPSKKVGYFIKTGCRPSKREYTVWRTFVQGEDFYLAHLSIWVK